MAHSSFVDRARNAFGGPGSFPFPCRVRERRVSSGRWSALRCGSLHDGERRVAGGRLSALRCGGRPLGPTALRCSLREGGCDASAPALNGPLHRDFSPACCKRGRLPLAALRCSAPQRRAAHRPPATLREAQGESIDVPGELHRFEPNPSRTAAARKAVGGRPGARLVRRRGAQGPGGCRAEGAVERSCLSTVGRAADVAKRGFAQFAQRSDAKTKKASSSLAPGHRATQSSRCAATTAAPKRTRPPTHGFARSTFEPIRSARSARGPALSSRQARRAPQ